MKKILVVGLALSLSAGLTNRLYAQSESTALSLAQQHDARGSARYQALSGAMGAIGADFSSIHQNPAGLSYFRSGSKLSLSLAHSTYGANNVWNGSSTSLSDKNRLHIDEISYVSNFTTGSGMNVAYGIGVQNNGRMQRRTNAFTQFGAGANLSSLADYSTATLNNIERMPILGSGVNPYQMAPWIGALGYEAIWNQYDASRKRYVSAYQNSPLEDASLILNEVGATSNFDFALAAEFSPSFSLGGSVSFTTLDYEYTSFYQEKHSGVDTKAGNYGLSLDSKQSISGLGVRFALGALVRPVEALRLGASIYSPVFYSNMNLDSYARGVGVSELLKNSPYAGKGAFETHVPLDNRTSFGFSTPWRFTLSGAYVFGRRAILSADYEYQNYAGPRLRNAVEDDYDYGSSSNIYSSDNDAIKEDFGGTHTWRLGLEYNLSRRLALRLGYKTVSAPDYAPELKKDIPVVGVQVAGTAVHYRLPGAANNYSVGLGYKLSPKWTLDLAYSYNEQAMRVGAFPFIRDTRDVGANSAGRAYEPLPMIKETQRQSNVTATLSYRF